MKRNLIYIASSLFLMGLLSLEKGSSKNAYSYGPNRVSFGVKIGLLPTGELTQYSLFFFKDQQLVGNQPIDLPSLIKIGTGKWPIPRTNIFTNIFEEKGFKLDTLPDGKIVDYNSAFDSLWKIRFEAHPYKHELGEGWSQGEIRPSTKQQVYIYDRYGVRGYDQDYFVDTSFFKLLKDVIDPTWINNYKSLR
ncbi:hypothetical protein [Brumimicrobium aurantiacum]|uniref:Uncharacterized protein n=1 Tax=Brumimicrobium aurantiacum TaxID=1737063 RepID=A0A3E1EVD5_9FLAO|nr:hypothetical protein [Brumimicrobium aurantiacum]RFC53521.1 hypothetical protein DXU93_12205 [Brumimicrobium aurantiacum]